MPVAEEEVGEAGAIDVGARCPSAPRRNTDDVSERRLVKKYCVGCWLKADSRSGLLRPPGGGWQPRPDRATDCLLYTSPSPRD
eukprot:4018262-Alexandrium_andersonii.AAC.1